MEVSVTESFHPEELILKKHHQHAPVEVPIDSMSLSIRLSISLLPRGYVIEWHVVWLNVSNNIRSILLMEKNWPSTKKGLHSPKIGADITYTMVPATRDPLMRERLVLCDRPLSAPNSIFCTFGTPIWDRIPTRDHPVTAEGAVFRCRDHCIVTLKPFLKISYLLFYDTYLLHLTMVSIKKE